MATIKGSMLALFLAFVLFAQGQQPATGVISASYPDGKPFTQAVAFTAYDVHRGLLFGAGNYGKIYTFNSTTLVLLSTFDLRASTFSTFNFGIISLPLGIHFRETGKRIIASYAFGYGESVTGRAHTALLDATNPYNMTILSALGFPESIPTRYDTTLYEPSTDLFMRIAHPSSESSYLLELYTYKIINDTTLYFTRNRPPGDNYLYSGSIPQFGKRPAIQVLRPFYNGTVFFTFDRNSIYSVGQYGSGTFEAQIAEQATSGSLLDTEVFKLLRNPSLGSGKYFGSITRDNPDPKDFDLGLNSVYLLLLMDTYPSKGCFVAQISESNLLSYENIPKSLTLFANDPSFSSISADERIDGTSTNVFFIATNTGRLFKFSFTDSGSALNVNTSPISLENIVASGVSFTEQTIIRSERRFLLHSNIESPTDLPKLFSVPFADCGSRTSCDSCVAMNDPYCGWCVLDGKCSYKSSCSSATSGGWQQTTGKCPSVSNVETISIYAEPVWISLNPSPLTFTINNIIPGDYSCEYKRENGSKYYKEVQGSLPNLWCGRPRIVTPLTNGSPSETLSVSLSYLNPSSGHYSNIVQISNTIPLYDCNSFSTCESCVLLPGCGWMSDFNQCADETAFDVNANLPTQCPRTDSNFIGMYPHNQTISLSLSGSNFPYGMDYPLTCVFNTGESAPITRLDSNLVSCESPLVIIESGDILPYKEVFIQVKHGDVVFPGQAKIVFVDKFKLDLLDF